MGRPFRKIEEGERFGCLTYIEDVSNDKGRRYSRFSCSCGKEVVANTYSVRCGQISSCGHQRGRKKLSEEQKLEIIEMSSKMPAKEIAIKYNLHTSTVRSIIRPQKEAKIVEGFFNWKNYKDIFQII